MNYVSTRGQAPKLNFSDALLTGLAVDGGLYVPEQWPVFSKKEIENLRGLSYAELALEVLRPLVGEAIKDQDLEELIENAYQRFDHKDVAPLKQLNDGLWLLELFHGPTLAFKDFAMQLLGQLFEHELARRKQTITIIGATSGDTGSAAIEAFRNSERARVFILYPHNRVSDIQRRQMTTVAGDHIHTIAVEGTFDDCQNMVKAMFADSRMRNELNLSAVNSINWARVSAQIVYYFYAALALGAPNKPISFAVPTGNFGNIYAGYGAMQMGLPVNKLIIGSNRNDILTRFCQTGRMQTTEVVPTLSPSMDIQISSNFERILFELYERDTESVRMQMDSLKTEGVFAVEDLHLEDFRQIFDAHRYDDQQTTEWICKLHEETSEVLDPHTVIGVAAAHEASPDHDTICLATAHPSKFPEAMQKAIGRTVELPNNVKQIEKTKERFWVLENNLDKVKEFIYSS